MKNFKAYVSRKKKLRSKRNEYRKVKNRDNKSVEELKLVHKIDDRDEKKRINDEEKAVIKSINKETKKRRIKKEYGVIHVLSLPQNCKAAKSKEFKKIANGMENKTIPLMSAEAKEVIISARNTKRKREGFVKKVINHIPNTPIKISTEEKLALEMRRKHDLERQKVISEHRRKRQMHNMFRIQHRLTMLQVAELADKESRSIYAARKCRQEAEARRMGIKSSALKNHGLQHECYNIAMICEDGGLEYILHEFKCDKPISLQRAKEKMMRIKSGFDREFECRKGICTSEDVVGFFLFKDHRLTDSSVCLYELEGHKLQESYVFKTLSEMKEIGDHTVIETVSVDDKNIVNETVQSFMSIPKIAA